jgi:hypothetical protein
VPGITVGWQGTWPEASVFLGDKATNILALMDGIGVLAFIFLVTKITRSRAIALTLGALFAIGFNLFGENILIEVLIGLVLAVLWLTCLMRVGLLAVCVARFVVYTLTDGLLTFDFSRWYAWRGFAELVIVVALALYGFKVALGAKPLLTATLED